MQIYHISMEKIQRLLIRYRFSIEHKWRAIKYKWDQTALLFNVMWASWFGSPLSTCGNKIKSDYQSLKILMRYPGWFYSYANRLICENVSGAFLSNADYRWLITRSAMQIIFSIIKWMWAVYYPNRKSICRRNIIIICVFPEGELQVCSVVIFVSCLGRLVLLLVNHFNSEAVFTRMILGVFFLLYHTICAK